jgi:hypothetical protein
MVVKLEHRAKALEDPLPEGATQLVWGVTLDDQRGEDENFVCQAGREVLSDRPVAAVVREAVEAELRIRDMRVGAPKDANVVLHIVLHDFGCRGSRRGLEGYVDSEIGLRLMPEGREVYWTTLNERAARPATPSIRDFEQLMQLALQDAVERFARHVATHPDVMIEIQKLQERGKLPL